MTAKIYKFDIVTAAEKHGGEWENFWYDYKLEHVTMYNLNFIESIMEEAAEEFIYLKRGVRNVA